MSAETPVIFCPTTHCAASMMCAPMSPRAPEPALDLSSRQVIGPFSSLSQSCRYWARTCRITPRRPCSTSRLASASAGVLRYEYPHMAKTPLAAASSAAAAIDSASATEFANGFSHSTCLPACRAAMAISACVSPGVQMSTRSMSGRSIRRLQPVSAESQPSSSAAFRTASVSRPAMAVICGARGSRKKCGAVRQACEWAAPMKP